MSEGIVRTVVCAIDDSALAPAVVYAAVGVAEHLSARLIVVRADPRAGQGEEPRQAATAALEEFMLNAVPGGVGYRAATETRVVPGSPAEAVLRVAAEEEAGLIVMGTRGRGFLGRAMLGSTARDVLQGARVPVAVVPPSSPEIAASVGGRTVPRFGIVLVPLDLQSDAQSQLAVTAMLGSGSTHRPLLMHVADPDTDHVLLRERLNRLGLSIPGGRGAKLLILDGEVADCIVRVTTKDDVGLVILGRAHDDAGEVACAVLERSRAVVVVVP